MSLYPGGGYPAQYSTGGNSPVDFVFNAVRRTLTAFIAWQNQTACLTWRNQTGFI